MKVTKEWLLEKINLIPDKTEVEITGADYTLFEKLSGTYKEPPTVYYPPEDAYPCSDNGKHVWGFMFCRCCYEPWPEPYLSDRIKAYGY